MREPRSPPSTHAEGEASICNVSVECGFEGSRGSCQFESMPRASCYEVPASAPKTLRSLSFSLIDCISVGVDRMQRNFEPMRKQVEAWQRTKLTDVTAKVVIYEKFVEGRLEAPKHLARTVHDQYFEPRYEEFQSPCVQGTRTHSAIQSDSKTGRILGDEVLAVILARRDGSGRAAALPSLL
jgi:hypothetical protein